MSEVPATEFVRNFGRYREAAQRDPVAVQSHGRVTGYFVSAHEFEEYKRVKAMMPVALAVEELDAKTIKRLKAAKMDSRHAALDRLMD